ncbi:hypothetical protein SETIT_6G251200v2 [Setaria italica]|uniref:Uncharacterized protein n=1 Tax=Setaria italica TaxID=4555 RepID=A0A368RQC4_SETIT|nr:hypothetical protein SETIT_6G251200v2 [Setaria italica]
MDTKFTSMEVHATIHGKFFVKYESKARCQESLKTNRTSQHRSLTTFETHHSHLSSRSTFTRLHQKKEVTRLRWRPSRPAAVGIESGVETMDRACSLGTDRK